MARNQRSKKKADEFKCPECGRTFTRAAALGAHRRQAHGVVGAVSAARAKQRSRTQTARSQRAKTRSAGRRTLATKSSPAKRSTRSSQTTRARSTQRGRSSARTATTARQSTADGRVNRDSLLGTLFPNGLPAKEEVLRAANKWLDDAERLARMR
jgi:hypothetical protein